MIGTFSYVQSFSSELFATQPRQGLKGIQLFSQNSEYRAGWLYIYRRVGPVFCCTQVGQTIDDLLCLGPGATTPAPTEK